MKTKASEYARALLFLTDGKTGAELTRTIKDFVRMLADRHELSRWREIVPAFDNAWRRKYGIANVRFETAHPVTDALMQRLKTTFSRASLTCEVREELVGGAVLSIDDRRLDGSVAGQLTQLEAKLSS